MRISKTLATLSSLGLALCQGMVLLILKILVTSNTGASVWVSTEQGRGLTLSYRYKF